MLSPQKESETQQHQQTETEPDRERKGRKRGEDYGDMRPEKNAAVKGQQGSHTTVGISV